MSIEAIVKEFSAVAANPKGQLKAYKDAGKKCIGVMPYYAPEELVYAAGMMPFGMWGSNNKTIQRAKEYCATFYCTIRPASPTTSPARTLIFTFFST